jgi:NitT/TauT family transport system substrate-binding protein
MSYRMRWMSVAVAILVAVAAVACQTTRGGQTGGPAPTSVNVAVMTPPDMLKQMASGDIDGFIAWEPFPTTAVKAGDGKVLLLSKDIWPGHPCCVLAVAPTVKDPAARAALAWANIQATAWMNDPKNADQAAKYGAEFTTKPEDVVAGALTNIKYGPAPNIEGLKNYYAQLTQYGLLKKTPQDLGYDSEDALFKAFIDEGPYKQALAAGKTAPKAPAASKIRITHIQGDLHHLAHYVAKKEGFYASAGLVLGKNLIEVAPYANGAAIMEGFKNKELDAAYLGGAPAVLKRVNDDTKITVIAGVNDLGSSLVVGTDSGIEKPADLAGKTVAVPSPGSVQDVLLRRLLATLGLEYSLKQ